LDTLSVEQLDCVEDVLIQLQGKLRDEQKARSEREKIEILNQLSEAEVNMKIMEQRLKAWEEMYGAGIMNQGGVDNQIGLTNNQNNHFLGANFGDINVASLGKTPPGLLQNGNLRTIPNTNNNNNNNIIGAHGYHDNNPNPNFGQQHFSQNNTNNRNNNQQENLGQNFAFLNPNEISHFSLLQQQVQMNYTQQHQNLIAIESATSISPTSPVNRK
jgi:hypothetical protein